VGLTCNKFKMA